MNLEDTLGVLLEAKLSPVRSEVGRLTAQVEALRRALPPLLLTPAEAAKVLRTSVSTVRRRIKDGSLPINRTTGRPLVDLGAMHPPADADVLRLAISLRNRSTAQPEDDDDA